MIFSVVHSSVADVVVVAAASTSVLVSSSHTASYISLYFSPFFPLLWPTDSSTVDVAILLFPTW